MISRSAKLLEDLAKYWGVQPQSVDFVDRLKATRKYYPSKLYDAVEQRTLSFLGGDLQTSNWLLSRDDQDVLPDSLKGLLREIHEAPELERIALIAAKQKKLEAERLATERRTIAAQELQARNAHEKAMRERTLEEVTRANELAAHALNTSRKYDLFIFDLDDTLLETSHLEEFRGINFIGPQSASYVNALVEQAKTLTRLVCESMLLSLQQDFPGLRLSIFTRSPKVYASTLLKTCFPRVRWDSVVAFEDVRHTKPSPEGIHLAARSADVEDMSRIALIGDGKSDLIAAYQAGVDAVLYTQAWGEDWNSKNNVNRNEHYASLGLMADAKLAAPEHIRKFLVDPISFLPSLEAWDIDPTFTETPQNMRVDVQNHFNNLEDAGQPNWIEVYALSRYFPIAHSGWYTFRAREARHQVTKAILDAKEGIAYPIAWAECCANYVVGYAQYVQRMSSSLIVCTIPSSSGSIRPVGKDRLVDFLNMLSTHIQGRCVAELRSDILEYKPGASSNKTLSKDDRFANVRDHLFVAQESAIAGKSILVIDDVATSGATFFYASRYLRQAGAKSVRCLALAQTVS